MRVPIRISRLATRARCSPTTFGGSGGEVNVFGSQSGALYVAGAGNETVDAAQSTISGPTGNLFWGSSAAGSNDLMIAGAGTDTLAAGAGHDTLTGGPGSDAFVFFQSNTAGTNVTTINDLPVAIASSFSITARPRIRFLALQ